MDPVLLARFKFAMTIGFHFIFPPITIGMAWLLVWMLSRWRASGDEAWGRAARFWLKVFGITFAVGVATGITMEFQFGTNWAKYSRFVGDIFGAPLAAEAIFTFFLESTFIGVLLFGWGRLSKRTIWFASLMVAVGATLSAFWIIVANSWMQTPDGYRIAKYVVNGIVIERAELTDFAAAVFNASTLPRFFHTMAAALTTGAMFVAGLSAWLLLKGRHVDIARRSLASGLVLALVASVVQMGLGHWHAVQVAHTQPEKLAAFEGLYDTQEGAPALLFGIPNDETERTDYAVAVPRMLSLLAFGDMDAKVQGLKDWPKDQRPPTMLTFFPFHIMVALSGYFVLMPALGLWLWWRKRLFDSRLFLRIALWSIPLPILACQLGWMSAEVGRQPWIVYRVMRTSDAISPASVVSAGHILFSIIVLAVIYLGLFVGWVYLLRRQLTKGPAELPATEAPA